VNDVAASHAARVRALWIAVFAAAGALVVARNLAALSWVPPGLYADEASVGYNAWTIAQFGVDEHGIRFPLFFEAFGEYKNPIYIYALAPLLLFLPLTSAVARFPAALFGLITVLFVTMAAWRLSHSRLVALLVLALAALTPWLTQESRLGFEVSAVVALLAVGFWCLADEQHVSPARFAIAGTCFGLAVYGYTSARLEVLLFAGAFVVAYAARRSRRRGWPWFLAPIGVAYVLLGIWGWRNPGALTARFDLLSIASDGAPLPTLIARFLHNYVGHFSPGFLFINGDDNLRHNTGFTGMLLAVTLPLMLVGIWACWRRRAESLPRFVLLTLLLGPAAAALTVEPVPHSLRSAVMLPGFLLLAAFGLAGIRSMLAGRALRAAAAAIAVALLAQGGLYTIDMYTAYPMRSAIWFDTGVEPAIAAAAAARRDSSAMYVSSTLEVPYIQVFFALRPPPPASRVSDAVSAGLSRLGVRIVDPRVAGATARAGDVLVLGGGDMPPAGSFEWLDIEYAPRNPLQTNAPRPVLAYAVKLL